MKPSRILAAVICMVISLVFANASIGGERGIQVKRIDDLSHESGKLGEYKALIIGINDYKGPRIPDLETPINDATVLAKVLKEKYGFKVRLLLDREATKEAIYKGLRNLAASTKPSDSVLIYFAGHGDLDRTYNDGWWIPADAKGGNPVTYFDNVQVQKAMRSMKARHVLLISDSCYSGTLFGKARSLPHVIDDKYYMSLYNEKSRWGMTSGNKTPVSDQGTGGHSVFAYQLIKELEKNDKPFLSTQEICTRIAPVIANNSDQTPLCRPIVNTGDQGGEFVFVASLEKEPKSVIPEAQQGNIDKEILFWQSIQDNDSQSLFEAYLEKFPSGFFAPIAREKIEALKQKKATASVSPMVRKTKLFVEVEPATARIRILNIGPKFYQGMELDPGRYHVEVSSNGYETIEVWKKLEAGRDETLRFTLKKKTVPQKEIFQRPEMKKGYYSDPGKSAPAPESPEIHAENTASPAGGNRWDWTVFIRASRDVLEQINCVEYTLHPTFPNPVRTVCRKGSPDRPFALSSNGWGTFTIDIRVMMKNGQEKKLQHALRFR
ncbi:caspase domain protein [delta proteobacterium NaphS2]|nr:caspase domain protein [delta proteobacterium NaphS2]